MSIKNSSLKEIQDPFINQVIFSKYKIKKRIGKGSFGSIYLVEHNNKLYAMKLENTKKGFYILEKEVKLMNILYGPRIPYVKSFGQCGYYNVLIMEVLGKSLEDLKEILPSKKMSIPCICKLSYQMLQILEHIHKKYYIHRDIKPENFLMGIGPNNKFLYIIDLGFAKPYRDLSTLAHLPMNKNQGMTGTSRFASINTLSGYTQSRRDDLESLAYVIIYLTKGTLPWAGIKGNNKDDLYNKILNCKIKTTTENLCQGLPKQFEEYVKYVKNMTYEQDPDYNYLKNLFLNVLLKNGKKMDFKYDWDDRINDLNTLITNNENNNNENNNNNINNNNIIPAPTPTHQQFIPNIEKLFNNDETLRNNYNKEVEIAIQKKIYTRNEINESNIEPYPIDTLELDELNLEYNKKDMINGKNKRLNKEGCQCCIII